MYIEGEEMLKTRIEILEQANVISKEVAEYVNEVIDMMCEELKEFDVEKAEMFTTHIAMAAERGKSGEGVEELDRDIWISVTESENYGKAAEFYEKMLKEAPIQFPENEKQFIMLHLCNLLEQEKRI